MRILIVEDEHRIAQAVKEGLEQESYAVDVAYDGEEGYNTASAEAYDLILLDVMMPGMDGFEVCRKLRQAGKHTPVLMLTAKDQNRDIVRGLDTGADDYLAKPFSFEILLARVRALLRRPHETAGELLQAGDLSLNPSTKLVKRGGTAIALSAKEYALLEYLLRNQDRVLSKNNIMTHVWDFDADILPNTVEVFMTYLRAKVDKPFAGPGLIQTVRGFGYKNWIDDMNQATATTGTATQLARLKIFVQSSTARLAATYLVIILVMSIGFSFVLYNTSSHELGRQLPPDSLFRHGGGQGGLGGGFDDTTTASVTQFLQTRIDQARDALMLRLLLLNLLVLIGGAILSYYLSRRTLQPIEEAMEAQVQFVSDASHELRTPLTAIQTSNEVALRKKDLTLPAARQLIEQNTEDIIKLKTLSDGLLNLAQHHQTEVVLGPINLQDVASQAMTQVVGQANAKDISVQDNVAVVQVLGDANSLAQVLVILLDNAIKYSHDGGTIYLETRVKGKQVYFDVHDEGIGIRASDMPHLFRRFYRADNARTSTSSNDGYGLGLAIAQQIISSQGGEISAVSTLGTGSTFSISLPAVQSSSQK